MTAIFGALNGLVEKHGHFNKHVSTNYIWLLVLFYPILVATLRYQRLRTTLKTFPYTTRRSFARMTDNDACQIQMIIAQLEFPFTFNKAVQFALFRTYGIPSISRLLVKTSQFSEVATASKRYADTGALIREFTSREPSHPRSLEAIARMNYIHSVYQKSGQISDDDMLYTLSLFVLEPIRWIARYEWRSLEDFERCGTGTYWKSLGDAMRISYEPLPSSQTGWDDALQWLDELDTWSMQYEIEHMVPHADNNKTADQTVAILLWGLPRFLRSFGENIVTALMDERLRVAMMYKRPAEFYYILLSSIFTVRKFLLRYLSLPRPSFLRVDALLEAPKPDGRQTVSIWEGAPYYVKPTFWRRWGFEAWGSRLLGLPVPGDEGDKYHPEGYRIPDVGPKLFFGKGKEPAEATVAELRKVRTGGCPFVSVKAL
ncbi:MAG: hypothetical protein Q9220_003396 [cf. Caloplaca sp. 1 TL-2023]